MCRDELAVAMPLGDRQLERASAPDCPLVTQEVPEYPVSIRAPLARRGARSSTLSTADPSYERAVRQACKYCDAWGSDALTAWSASPLRAISIAGRGGAARLRCELGRAAACGTSAMGVVDRYQLDCAKPPNTAACRQAQTRMARARVGAHGRRRRLVKVGEPRLCADDQRRLAADKQTSLRRDATHAT